MSKNKRDQEERHAGHCPGEHPGRCLSPADFNNLMTITFCGIDAVHLEAALKEAMNATKAEGPSEQRGRWATLYRRIFGFTDDWYHVGKDKGWIKDGEYLGIDVEDKLNG